LCRRKTRQAILNRDRLPWPFLVKFLELRELEGRRQGRGDSGMPVHLFLTVFFAEILA
jgi:hypothetical protein